MYTHTNKPRRRIKGRPDEEMSAEPWLVARVTGTRLPACGVCCSCCRHWESHMMKMMMGLGPIHGSPSQCGQSGCVSVCVCGLAWMCLRDKARVSTVGQSPWNQCSQSSAGAFYNSSVFTKTPPACVEVTEASCALSPWNLSKRSGE